MKDSIKFKEKLLSLNVDISNIKSLISIYESIPEGILDASFISKINNDDSLRHRLSELYISYLFYKKHTTSLIGMNHGPDLVINYGKTRVNIEIVTPLIVENTEGNFQVFEHGKEQFSRTGIILEPNSFRLRVSSVFKDKIEQFTRWLKDGIVKEDDINVICINTNYIKNMIHGDMDSLWKVFYRDYLTEVQRCDDGEHLCMNLVPRDNIAYKVKGTEIEPITQNYFENEDVDTSFISAALIFHLDNPLKQYGGTGIIFKNPSKSNIFDLNEILKVDGVFIKNGEHPDAYLNEQIKKNNGMIKI